MSKPSLCEVSEALAGLLERLGPEGLPLTLTHQGKPLARLQAYLGEELVEDPEANALLLHQAAEMAVLGYWIWDEIEDRCVFCSDTLAKMNGVTVEDYLATQATMKDLLPRVHPEDRDAYEQVINNARETLQRYDVELRYRRADGSYHHVRECGEPVLNAEGRLVRTIGILQDISEQKATEKALRDATQDLEQKVAARTHELQRVNATLEMEVAEHKRSREALKASQEQLQAFIENSPTEIGIKDRAGRYAMINPVSERLYGLKAEEIIGRLPRDIFPQDIAQQLEAQDQCVLATGEPDMREIAGAVNGEQRTYLATKFAISDASGEPGGLGAIAIDITEQKRAEESLRASETRYRDLLENSPLPILEENWSAVKLLLDNLTAAGVTDLLDYFHNHPDALGEAYERAERFGVTQAAVRLYRANSKQQLQASMSRQWADPDELRGYAETLAAFHAGASHYEYEANETALDDQPIITRIRIVLPAGHREDWSRVLMSIEDITDYRAAEERLRQAQKMEVVGQLTGGVAHDFNNLLAIIQGNAELLAERTEDCERLIRPIVHAAVRGGELTQRLLAFSRRQPLVPQAIDLAAMVQGLMEILPRTLGETFEITALSEPGLWPALADPGQLENALVNLVLNARDAMPEGGRVTIASANVQLGPADLPAHPDLIPGDFVVITVSDSGPGMTSEVRAHAFEPFFTTKGVREGSGLGLSMVYGFAKQSGGQVTLESEVGKGTVAKIYLPRAAGSCAPEKPYSAQDLHRGAGELILVIEDDPDVRTLARHLLENLGYRVITVPDAIAARERLAEGKPVDLVLSDVVLPGGISGPALAEQLRAAYPALRVIFMSGYPAEATKRNGVLGSEQVLLSKPFQRSQLAKVLRQALA